MENRSIGKVIALSLVTLGIYTIYLLVKTKEEMNALGAEIPTAWLIIVPIANYWWYWKYSEGVERVTNKEIPAILGFVLLIAVGGVAQIIFQVFFNKVGQNPAVPAGPQIAVNPAVPTDGSFQPTMTAAPVAIAPEMPTAPAEPAAPSEPAYPTPATEVAATPAYDQAPPAGNDFSSPADPTIVPPAEPQAAPAAEEPTEPTPPVAPISPSNPL